MTDGMQCLGEAGQAAVLEARVSAAEDDGWGPLDGLPGNPMMWILILGELVVFAALLVGFCVAKALAPEAFRAGQANLSVALGGLNTGVLVASGWLAAVALHQVRGGRSGRLPLAGAMALGAGFLALKGVEYADKLAAGHGMDSGSFYELYYLITGFHALHVVMGLVILGLVALRNSTANVETGTAFWHMVDLIWLLAFPIVYLVR